MTLQDREACHRCQYSRTVHCQDEFCFTGCDCKPYHGKWITEIKDCPIREEIKMEMEKEPVDFLFL